MRSVSLVFLLGCSSDPASVPDAESPYTPPWVEAGVEAGMDVARGGDASDAGDAAVKGVLGPRFVGRWDADQSSWSHSSVELRFTGTDVAITLDGASVLYEVLLDGQRSKFMGGKGTFMLGQNLSNGPHTVTVVRRQESFFGVAKFVSFSVPQNQWLPIVPPSRRIEIIGDSISAGYGNEGCPFGPNENADLAYGPVAARAVGADVHVIATSGIGMAKSLNNAPTMPQIYEHTFGSNNTTPWDFTKYAPDVVVINLGTNDNAAGVDKTAYKAAYTSFLGVVRGHYPSALVYCVSQGGNTLVPEIQAVVAGKNDPKIKYLALSGNLGGCMGHPDVAGDQQMASQLVTALKADLGW